ncbi:MAG TPA: argininosuccinate synthase [Chloroflexota bacterium]|jgi:argininosuccinate synthase|nr:argininosuccinate synthase [Chloroflexota bacterium]
MQTVVLAYSGGLDTSVAIRWLQEKYDLEVVTLTADLGGDINLEAAREKALQIGAKDAFVVDAREEFVDDFVMPALQANALYEREYPLATALARPLIARIMVDIARKTGATLIAHGCTGKGNDQVRFDVATHALAPELKVIAPIREWHMSREEEIQYARSNAIPVPAEAKSQFSTDENVWGRSCECGVLEDPAVEPPPGAYAWTVDPQDGPADPIYVEIEIQEGVPVAVDGEKLGSLALVERLNRMGGAAGVGRIDMIENRLVGLKSREIYEAPAAVILHAAHRAVEDLTLTKDSLRFGELVSQTYSDLIYNGLWFGGLRRDLAAYVASSQRYVNGTARMRLYKGSCVVVGRESPHSLYDLELATYGGSDEFDYKAADGFISLWGLPLRTQARKQNLAAEVLGKT